MYLLQFHCMPSDVGVPVVVVVCHDQVCRQVSQGFRCRDSYRNKLIPPDSAKDPLVTSQLGVWCK